MTKRFAKPQWISTPLVIAMITVLSIGVSGMSFGTANAGENPVVVMQTSFGDITIELYPDKAPKTVENFLWYVDNKFYNGLIFHRVISNFMIQGGGFTPEMNKKQANAPIKNEANNGLSNAKGTIAMARTGEPHSATAQFFINVKDNKGLDFKSETPQGWGYCVFGEVIDGMDVVEEIRQVKTTNREGYQDVPEVPVVIEKAYLKETKGGAKKAAESEG